jgi:uncharacterized protein (TIGR03663 family)
MQSENSTTSWLDHPLFSFLPSLKIENILIVLILLAAIVSRFYDLGLRVMSHDEVNHMVPSYSLFTGKGYAYDPVTHGPLQFHLIAASFYLVGDSDFGGRLPAALFSIATIVIVLFAFRPYLGRIGALIAGFLFLISPYMLFYGRYARNEAFIVVWGLGTLFATLKYLETGKVRYLFLFALVMAFHFIFAGEIGLFLFAVFFERITRRKWLKPDFMVSFVIFLVIAGVLGAGAFGLSVLEKPVVAATAPSVPVVPGAPQVASTTVLPGIATMLLLVGALVLLGLAVFFLVRGLGWRSGTSDHSI